LVLADARLLLVCLALISIGFIRAGHLPANAGYWQQGPTASS